MYVWDKLVATCIFDKIVSSFGGQLSDLSTGGRKYCCIHKFIYNESLLALWAAAMSAFPIKIHTAIAVQHNYAMVVAVHESNTHPEQFHHI